VHLFAKSWVGTGDFQCFESGFSETGGHGEARIVDMSIVVVSGWTCVDRVDGRCAAAEDVLRLVVTEAFVHFEHAVPVDSRLHLLAIITDHRLIFFIHLVLTALHTVVFSCLALNILIRCGGTVAEVVADLSGAIHFTGEWAARAGITL